MPSNKQAKPAAKNKASGGVKDMKAKKDAKGGAAAKTPSPRPGTGGGPIVRPFDGAS